MGRAEKSHRATSFSRCCVENRTTKVQAAAGRSKLNWMRGSENGVTELPAPCSQSRPSTDPMRGRVSGRTCQKGTPPGKAPAGIKPSEHVVAARQGRISGQPRDCDTTPWQEHAELWLFAICTS